MLKNEENYHISTMSHFLIKRVRKIRNKSLNCEYMYLTITKITIHSCSKFSCRRPFYVIFVIVILNWQIWCGFLIVNGLVLLQNGIRLYVKSRQAGTLVELPSQIKWKKLCRKSFWNTPEWYKVDYGSIKADERAFFAWGKLPFSDFWFRTICNFDCIDEKNFKFGGHFDSSWDTSRSQSKVVDMV